MSERGLEFGMKLVREEIDVIQNSRGLKIPMQGLERKERDGTEDGSQASGFLFCPSFKQFP